MKKRLQAALLAAGLAVVSGCAEKQDALYGVRIAPTIKTRVTGLHFDPGDRIGLSIVKGAESYVENQLMSYDGAAFTASGLLWYNDLNETSTLTAYHPYSEAGVPAEFTVAADQTAGCASSDLLGAVRRGVTPANTAVGMVFYHLMSQLTVVITNNSDAEVSGVTVAGTVPTAVVDLTVPAASAKAGVAAADIAAFEVTPDAAYRVIVVPQQAELTVTVSTRDGKSRSKSLQATLESGRRYDMSVVVTNIDLELTLSGDIHDWTDGGSLGDGGQGGEGGGEPAGRLVYEGETYATAVIGGQEWMAENLRMMPADAGLTNGVWYPVGGAAALESQGYLYTYAAATGSAARAGGPLRGICPEGWHIPALSELQALSESAGFSKDFLSFGGYRIVSGMNDTYGDPDKAYLMSSDLSTDGRCHSLMYSRTSDPVPETVSASFGISLRCVKD